MDIPQTTLKTTETMRKIWDKFVNWLLSIPVDRRLHFVCGFMIATFFYIMFGLVAGIFFPVAAAIMKEGFDSATGGKWDWWDFAATIIGGLMIPLFAMIHIWVY